MDIINPAIFIVLEHFPEHREMVRHLFMVNEDFQILCEDFRQCRDALKHWNQSDKPYALTRSQEYRMLQQDLESEIVQFLDNTPLSNKIQF